MNHRLSAGQLVVLMGLAVVSFVGSSMSQTIGYRHDNTGVFPADCKPVLNWSAETNIVWKTPLPNYSNSSPIAVGKKVFTISEPGYESDVPVAICLDADTGKTLWTKPLDYFDLLPAADRKKAVAMRTLYYDRLRAERRYVFAYNNAKTDDERRDVLKKAQADGVLIKAEKKGRLERRIKASSLQNQNPQLKSVYGELRKRYGFAFPTWGPCSIGTTFPTPVSDGKHVIYHTFFRQVVCLDLDGRIKWMHWYPDEKVRSHNVARHVHSPIIIDGKVITMGNHVVRAYDVDSGKLAWKVDAAMQLYMVGSPIRMDLTGPDGKTVPTVVTSSGEIIRVDNGVVLAKGVGCMGGGNAGPLTDGGNVLFTCNGSTGGRYRGQETRGVPKGVLAYRVTMAAADKAELKLLWTNERDGFGEPAPVYHNGVLYGDNHALDAKTGKEIKTYKARAKSAVALVGGHLFIPRKYGETFVVKVPEGSVVARNELPTTAPLEGEKRKQLITVTGHEKSGKWGAWCFTQGLPFFSGNRIFVRSYDYMYCIGDKSEPFTPSKAFEAK